MDYAEHATLARLQENPPKEFESVIAFNSAWIDESNPKGIRIGWRDLPYSHKPIGNFVSAHYEEDRYITVDKDMFATYSEEYQGVRRETIEELKKTAEPTHWMPLPSFEQDVLKSC